LKGDITDADSKVNCGGPLRAACRRRRTHGPKLTTSASNSRSFLWLPRPRELHAASDREPGFGVASACVRMCADARRRKETIAFSRGD
jgi:hypothetical protein